MELGPGLGPWAEPEPPVSQLGQVCLQVYLATRVADGRPYCLWRGRWPSG